MGEQLSHKDSGAWFTEGDLDLGTLTIEDAETGERLTLPCSADPALAEQIGREGVARLRIKLTALSWLPELRGDVPSSRRSAHSSRARRGALRARSGARSSGDSDDGSAGAGSREIARRGSRRPVQTMHRAFVRSGAGRCDRSGERTQSHEGRRVVR